MSLRFKSTNYIKHNISSKAFQLSNFLCNGILTQYSKLRNITIFIFELASALLKSFYRQNPSERNGVEVGPEVAELARLREGGFDHLGN